VNVLEKFGKKKTLLVTVFTTKKIFIFNIHVIYVFLNIHIDDRHFTNITKLKKRTKTAQALPHQGFCPFFPHHNALFQ
jgi:hypothetical protein